MKVLIGVDGSEGGWEALRQASAMLTPAHDEIVLYYSPPHFPLRALHADRHLVEKMRESLAQAVFDEARGRLPATWQNNVATITGEQNPRLGLNLAADEVHADLVAVGAHGLGKTRLLLGRVTRSLIHKSMRPVLIAKHAPVKHDRSAYRVLWAIDEIPQGPQAAALLSRLSWPPGATGSIVHVIDPLAMEMPEWFSERVGHDETFSKAWSADFDAEKKAKLNELAAFSSTLPHPFAGLPELLEGNAAQSIIDRAAYEGAELVIVGTRDLGTLGRFFLGSTAESILQFAPCSVLVVHMSVP